MSQHPTVEKNEGLTLSLGLADTLGVWSAPRVATNFTGDGVHLQDMKRFSFP